MSIAELELAPDEAVPEVAPETVYADNVGMLWLDLGDGELVALDYWLRDRLRRQYSTISHHTVARALGLRLLVPEKGEDHEGQGAEVPL